jgi:hypothetical protein
MGIKSSKAQGNNKIGKIAPMSHDEPGLNLLASSHSEHALNKNTTILPVNQGGDSFDQDGQATGNNTMDLQRKL